MKKLYVFLISLLLIFACCHPLYASQLPKSTTTNYKVAFYAADNYHILEDGKKSGYGYEMMQSISKHLQATFTYVGYDKTPKECEEMLKNGEVDIYTAAKLTSEREKYFAFSSHPAITSTTCLNVKRGTTNIISGDYSTYNGMIVGLLETHTYNDSFFAFANEKGFDFEVKYYKNPSDLSRALITGEVDAIVDSYVRTPEDEFTIETFGETPYYFMVRKEDAYIVQQIDEAIDKLNIYSPKWRLELFYKYYGVQDSTTELTKQESDYLSQLQKQNVVIRDIMEPDKSPYSWYEDGVAHGIVADMFAKTAEKLGLEYEIVTVDSKKEFEAKLDNGEADVWLDIIGNYEGNQGTFYKETEPYLTTTLSILRLSSASSKILNIGITRDNIEFKEVIEINWPQANIIVLDGVEECKAQLLNKTVDAVLMRSYRAEQIANEETRNRLRAEVVPESTLPLRMGINSNVEYLFMTIWEKALMDVSEKDSAKIIQKYLADAFDLSLSTFLYQHPSYLAIVIVCFVSILFFVVLWIQSYRRRKKELAISRELTNALKEVEDSNKNLEEQYRLVEAMSSDSSDGFFVDIAENTSTTIKVSGYVLPKEKRSSRPYDSTWRWFVERYVHAEDQAGLLNFVEMDHIVAKLKDTKEASYRYRHIERDQSISYCQVRFTPVGDGELKYFVFCTSHIDDIIRAEKAQQKELEEARDMAQAANKAKTAFLFNMSHDIRTPMNAIVGYTELILKYHDNEEKCMEYLHKIRSSSDFLLSLINNVLEMARVENGNVDLDEKVSSYQEIADEVYSVYSELMKQKNIDFTMQCSNKNNYVYLDRVKIKEIFLNIVSNAHKYTNAGGKVHLEIKENLDLDKKHLHVEIILSDTGIGMSKEFLPKLFDEFAREKSSSTMTIQGTGLGMPIVKRLIDAMGGTIQVESELGKGTTITINLSHLIANEKEVQQEIEVNVDLNNFVGKRILLAEDNDLNAEIAEEILQEVGFIVERAIDGVVCVNMLEKAPDDYYDLILMDIQMPNLDGYGATKQIRSFSNKRKASIPIVAITANAFDEDKKNAFAVGMDGHLGKPIVIPKLMALLSNIIQKKN